MATDEQGRDTPSRVSPVGRRPPDGLATHRPSPAPLRGPRLWPLPPWQTGDIVEYMGSKYVIMDIQEIQGELTVLLLPLLEHIKLHITQTCPDGPDQPGDD